ncbi:DUF862 domain-containing protein [Citrus sinensis]|uniref:DUF862 domain-containing protein n=2 Tax=Citrus TaxID=2706 RepID=A0ACB8MUU5_CITSI|nr:hypothetical protein CICLE_v10017891mg [Citrus x clementina]KAH9741167.1 DUF862 domain-containing protein [Citrus sinensis]KAH9789663.1 DUF862 domain-containing protein [Citrus sinensis]
MRSLSEGCCIYRVPQETRCLNESDFTPQVISIGPLHHGKEELKEMEEHKRRYLKHFLQRTKVGIEEFLTFIKDKEAKLRSYNSENIELTSDAFVTMILVDSIFMIECLLRYSNPDLVTNDDRIFGKSLYIHLQGPAGANTLLVNQLPFFILNDLFILAKTAIHGEVLDGLSLIELVISLMRDLAGRVLLIQKNILEQHFSKAEHMLDLLRLCLEPSDERSSQPQSIPNATELHQAGVKFQVGSSEHLLNITINKGILEIPLLTIYDTTEGLFRNLHAFETVHCDSCYINGYIIMMKNLVVTANDADLLVQNGYSALVQDLKAYCRYPLHRWKANLKQNYFNTPWASISVIAAVVLLLFTIIQAVCSIIAL